MQRVPAGRSIEFYTLLLVSPAHTINSHVNKTLPFNPLTDFTPIAQITRSAYVLVIAANSSITSIHDLIVGPQHKEVHFSHASSDTGGAPHLAEHIGGALLHRVETGQGDATMLPFAPRAAASNDRGPAVRTHRHLNSACRPRRAFSCSAAPA
jgi:tripartite-type tricarboxylate transporter receptor subunit TctC